ncbi:MAG: hypothetical protein ACXWCU_10770 [Caldimonas sp.]
MTSRQRLIAATLAASLSAIACMATIIEPHWFEVLFDIAPDDGDGSLETIVAVAISAIACIAFSWLGRREWRKSRPAVTRAEQA